MKVLICEPRKTARIAEIESDLTSMQNVVGGHIEAVYPYDDLVALVCNEEGKLNGLSLNRALRDEQGEIYDVVAGTFFVCGLGESDFESLSPEMQEKYLRQFKDPEAFAMINGKICSKKIPERPARNAAEPER